MIYRVGEEDDLIDFRPDDERKFEYVKSGTIGEDEHNFHQDDGDWYYRLVT